MKKANEGFKRTLKLLKVKKDYGKEVDFLFYLFYLEGFKEGAGMTQLVI